MWFFSKNPYSVLAESAKNYRTPRFLLALKLAAFLGMLLCLFFILSPYGKTEAELLPDLIKNKDIIAIVDVSESMNAEDGDGNMVTSQTTKNEENAPRKTRLDAVKDYLSLVVKQNPDNRFALIAFEKDAKTISPLSRDLASFISAYSGLRPRMLTQHGSDLFAGITEASTTLKKASDPVVLIFSDSSDGVASMPAEFLDISPIIYGVGTTQGARMRRWYDLFNNPIYRKYENADVIVKLDSEKLKKAANILSGKYIHLTDTLSTYKESFLTLSTVLPTKWNTLLLSIAAILFLLNIVIPLKQKR